MGRQMPPRGYWGVKCHLGVIGASNATLGYWGVKGDTGVKRLASEIRGVRDQMGGQESKFGRQGSQRQMARASKEMNPPLDFITLSSSIIRVCCINSGEMRKN